LSTVFHGRGAKEARTAAETLEQADRRLQRHARRRTPA
jgi:hypothetical protein